LSLVLLVCFWRNRPELGVGDALLCVLLWVYIATEWEARADPVARAVYWEWRLFGCLLVWRRRRPFSVFRAVEVWRNEQGDSDYDDVRVYLLSGTGKHLIFQKFHAERGNPCEQARWAAQSLEDTLDLEFHNHDTVV